MPLNRQKVVEIIFEECKSIELRCPGYRDELRNTVVDIVYAEWQNQTRRTTNIQQTVSNRCNATGRFLLQRQNSAAGGGLNQ